MKLYEFDYWESRGITCRELEVEKETEKCFFTKCRCRILKDNINKLESLTRRMICLSSDDTIFKNALIENYTRKIERYKEDISHCEKNIEEIRGCE